MNIGAFIPIRSASERLPKKAMKVAFEETILAHLVQRIAATQLIHDRKQIVVCTTICETDDELTYLAKSLGVEVFRGAENDIIKRFHDANLRYNFDVILQIDGDDPLIPPEYCDLVLSSVIELSTDVAFTKSLPYGANVKAFTAQALRKVHEAYKSTENDTGFGLYFLNEELCTSIEVQPVCSEHENPNIRLTLDYQEDLNLISQIIEDIYLTQKGDLSLSTVLKILNTKPHLKSINWFRQVEHLSRSEAKIELFASIGGQMKKITSSRTAS